MPWAQGTFLGKVLRAKLKARRVFPMWFTTRGAPYLHLKHHQMLLSKDAAELRKATEEQPCTGCRHSAPNTGLQNQTKLEAWGMPGSSLLQLLITEGQKMIRRMFSFGF